MNAYNDLIEYLEENEVLEHIVFGSWGWGGYNEPGCDDVDDECNELPPNPRFRSASVALFTNLVQR